MEVTPRLQAFLPGMKLIRDLPGKPPRLYGLWHSKEANLVSRATYAWPERVFPWAYALRIYYLSDKWERDRDNYVYVHDFTSKPPVLASIQKPDIPGQVVEKLLAPNIQNDAVNLPTLGLALLLEVGGADGVLQLSFMEGPEGPPNMSGTDDQETLIILHKDGPLFVRGGRMRLEAGGIHR